MADFMQQAVTAAADTAPAWLQDIQSRGRTAWQQTRMPTRKTEAWKYTSLEALQQPFAAGTGGNTATDVSDISFPALGGPTLVFADGQFRADLSSLELPPGLSLVRFEDASPEQTVLISAQLGTAVLPNRHVFAALNDATLADGVFLQVDANI
ncbi:MAG TPA: Fe-S cluster assembly protein SufD, partial [Kineobactrum sp.]